MKLNPLVYKLQLLKSCLHRGKQTIAFQEPLIFSSYFVFFGGGSRFLCHEQFIKAKRILCSFWAPFPSLLFHCNPISSDHRAMESQVKSLNSKATAVFRCDLINEVALLKRTHSLKPHIRISDGSRKNSHPKSLTFYCFYFQTWCFIQRIPGIREER